MTKFVLAENWPGMDLDLSLTLYTLKSFFGNQCNILVLLWRNTFTSLSYFFKFPMKWDLRWGVSEVCGNVSLTIHTTALCSRLGQLTLSPELQGCKLHFASAFSFYVLSHDTYACFYNIISHHLKSQSVCTVLYNGYVTMLHSIVTLHNLFAMRPNSLSCII